MHRRNLPLWPVALVVWISTSWLVEKVLPAEPGPFGDRPFARAVVAGGVCGLFLLAIDLWRHPRRLWLWGLFVWGAIFVLSAVDGGFGTDSDISQIVGGGFVIGGFVGLPLILSDVILRIGKKIQRFVRTRPRRWTASVKGSSIELTRAKDQVEGER